MRRFVWPMRVAIDPKEGCHYGQVITYIIWSIYITLNFGINLIKGQSAKEGYTLT